MYEGAILRDGHPQAMSRQCDTCIFRPGNLMHLGQGRLADIARRNRDNGSVLTCHKTLSYGEHPEIGQSACRGFIDAYPDNLSVTLVERLMGGWHLVDPPEDEKK